MYPWAPETCHIPFRRRQIVRSGLNWKRLEAASVTVSSPADRRGANYGAIQYPGMRHSGKGQSNDDLFIARSAVARKSENVLQIGGTDVDIREDRIYGVGIIVICHDLAPPCGRLLSPGS